jgi:transcriptional regulator with XRE-family HTH domain
MNFLEKLDMLMAEKGTNRKDLARGSGVPYTTILSMYDETKGYNNVKLSTLRKLALYFDCTIDYLADDNCNDKNKPFDINDLTPSELRMVETYARAKNSDKAVVKSLVKSIDKWLGIDEHESE